METENKNVLLAIIIGASLIISAGIGSYTFYKVRAMNNTLSVTGSAKKQVTSDMAKWSGNFSRMATINDMKYGYTLMAQDLEAVKKFFKDNGIEEKDIVISPVFVEQQYQYDQNRGPAQYLLRQNIEYQSSDLQKVTELANKSQILINSGVVFSPQPVEYYYTKLPEIRIELLGEAVKDARNRAEKIAQSSNKKISSIKSASVGVTQVLSVNSMDISDYGAYDTSKIEKEVTITVKALFSLK